MAKTNLSVETLIYKDVRGKELMYIRIKKGFKETLINVGEKTYNQVKAVTE